MFAGRRKAAELEYHYKSEVDFWKRELEKACNEKSYFAARALSAEQSLAARQHLALPLSMQSEENGKDAQVHQGQDQYEASQCQKQAKQGQRHRAGRYSKPASSTQGSLQRVSSTSTVDQHPEPNDTSFAAAAKATKEHTPTRASRGVDRPGSGVTGQGTPLSPSAADVEAARAQAVAADAAACNATAALESELGVLRAELAGAHDRIAGMEQEVGDLKVSLEQHQVQSNVDAAQAKEEVHRLRSALTAAQEASNVHTADIAALQHELSVVRGLSEDTTNQAASLLQALGEVRAHNAKLTAELAKKENLVALLMQQLNDTHQPDQNLSTTTTPPLTPQPPRSRQPSDPCYTMSTVPAFERTTPGSSMCQKPRQQGGSESPQASSSSTATALYSNGGGTGSNTKQWQAQQLQPQSSAESMADPDPAASAFSRAPSGRLHERTPRNKAQKLASQPTAPEEALDEAALEANRRRLSKTPPMERYLSNGVNWGRGGSVEAFGEGGTTVKSIIQRFQ